MRYLFGGDVPWLDSNGGVAHSDATRQGRLTPGSLPRVMVTAVTLAPASGTCMVGPLLTITAFGSVVSAVFVAPRSVTHTDIHRHTQTHTQTHKHTHAYIDTHTHAQTHTRHVNTMLHRWPMWSKQGKSSKKTAMSHCFVLLLGSL